MAMAEGFGGVDAAMNGVKGPGNNSPLKEVERVRSQFPETWLWTNTSVGYSYNAITSVCAYSVSLCDALSFVFRQARKLVLYQFC